MMRHICISIYSQQNLTFPIRCRCVLKAIIHRKQQWNVLRLLEKAFSFSKRCFLYVIVHACSIWLIFLFYNNLILFFMFLYLSILYYLNIWKNLLFFLINLKVGLLKRPCCWNITWLDIYLAILFLLSTCYLLLLSNQN